MKKSFQYKNIFMYASLQFCGHIDEYFAKRTEKLIVFIVMPRLKNKFNFLRVYRKGKMIEEKRVWSSENIILFYVAWYVNYLKFLLKYFRHQEKLVVLSWHPISFFCMTIQRLFRKIIFVYWVGDYFPPVNKYLYWFEKLKKYYHDKVSFRYYLSNEINRKVNGRIVEDSTHKTLMWGVKQLGEPKTAIKKQMNLLFVGLVKPGQGLEKLFTFLRTHKEYSLKIIGICSDTLFSEYQGIIAKYGIGKQVFFPNQFYSDEQLHKLARTCHIGIALYDVSPLSSAYYTDPGKVKSYAEMNLPIVMSNISSIALYIRKFGAGEVINEKPESLTVAIEKIKADYPKYLNGLDRFNRFFYYESYYKKAFAELEAI